MDDAKKKRKKDSHFLSVKGSVPKYHIHSQSMNLLQVSSGYEIIINYRLNRNGLQNMALTSDTEQSLYKDKVLFRLAFPLSYLRYYPSCAFCQHIVQNKAIHYIGFRKYGTLGLRGTKIVEVDTRLSCLLWIGQNKKMHRVFSEFL